MKRAKHTVYSIECELYAPFRSFVARCAVDRRSLIWLTDWSLPKRTSSHRLRLFLLFFFFVFVFRFRVRSSVVHGTRFINSSSSPVKLMYCISVVVVVAAAVTFVARPALPFSVADALLCVYWYQQRQQQFHSQWKPCVRLCACVRWHRRERIKEYCFFLNAMYVRIRVSTIILFHIQFDDNIFMFYYCCCC